MRLNSKVTWGLAWTGLAIVLAVPSADYLTGAFGMKGNTAAVITSTTDPVTTGSTSTQQKTARVTTRVTKTGVTIVPAGSPDDPVNKLLKSGKPLPDYISDDDGTAANAPTTAPALATTADETTQVANLGPAAAPMPFPYRPPDIVRPALPKATQPAAVIVDENTLPASNDEFPDHLAVAEPDGPLPPAGINDDWQNARDRRLTRYLEQRGLINQDSGPDSSASITIIDRPPPDYDPDGFYLSDGPNNEKARRRARIERMLQDEEDVSWF